MIVIKKCENVDIDEDDDNDDGGRSIMTHSKGEGCFIIKLFPSCETRNERKNWLKKKIVHVVTNFKGQGHLHRKYYLL